MYAHVNAGTCWWWRIVTTGPMVWLNLIESIAKMATHTNIVFLPTPIDYIIELPFWFQLHFLTIVLLKNFHFELDAQLRAAPQVTGCDGVSICHHTFLFSFCVNCQKPSDCAKTLQHLLQDSILLQIVRCVYNFFQRLKIYEVLTCRQRRRPLQMTV